MAKRKGSLPSSATSGGVVHGRAMVESHLPVAELKARLENCSSDLELLALWVPQPATMGKLALAAKLGAATPGPEGAAVSWLVRAYGDVSGCVDRELQGLVHRLLWHVAAGHADERLTALLKGEGADAGAYLKEYPSLQAPSGSPAEVAVSNLDLLAASMAAGEPSSSSVSVGVVVEGRNLDVVGAGASRTGVRVKVMALDTSLPERERHAESADFIQGFTHGAEVDTEMLGDEDD